MAKATICQARNEGKAKLIRRIEVGAKKSGVGRINAF
jgi:hypothetical protein